jgi:predicted acetyltransferase
MSFEIRPLTAEQMPAFRQAISAGFGEDADLKDEAAAERFAVLFDLDRMTPVFDGEEIVGTGGDFELIVTVPGGAQVAMSGLTVVSVRSTHTRQGVLSAMMRQHLDRAHERGEPLGGLWASEVPIYARYGYGPAVLLHKKRLDARQAGRDGTEPAVNVRIVDAAEAEHVLPVVYAEAQPTRPGMLQRSADWWKHRLLYDPEACRNGASALRHAVAERAGEPVGYASYRQKSKWDLLSEGEVRVQELVAADDGGYRALWHFVTSIDLFPIVEVWNTAPDDPLQLLVRDGRAVATTSVSDGLWIRLIDVAAALTKRAFGADDSLVMRVVDESCPWNDGTYRLEVTDGMAACERVVAESSVAMSVSALGALYLGGRDAVGLARAGLVEGDSNSVARLGAMFRTSPDPWCPEIF